MLSWGACLGAGIVVCVAVVGVAGYSWQTRQIEDSARDQVRRVSAHHLARRIIDPLVTTPSSFHPFPRSDVTQMRRAAST